jgi:hypothetical protein
MHEKAVEKKNKEQEKIIMNNNNYFDLINKDSTQSIDIKSSNIKREVEVTTPIILKKKIIANTNVIPLKTPNNLGHVRHFPAATGE